MNCIPTELSTAKHNRTETRSTGASASTKVGLIFNNDQTVTLLTLPLLMPTLKISFSKALRGSLKKRLGTTLLVLRAEVLPADVARARVSSLVLCFTRCCATIS